eukprot:1175721-Prorocentrum_minimum.AAC.1
MVSRLQAAFVRCFYAWWRTTFIVASTGHVLKPNQDNHPFRVRSSYDVCALTVPPSVAHVRAQALLRCKMKTQRWRSASSSSWRPTYLSACTSASPFATPTHIPALPRPTATLRAPCVHLRITFLIIHSTPSRLTQWTGHANNPAQRTPSLPRCPLM